MCSASAPGRTISASRDVRGDTPTVASVIASTSDVFPAPFGPLTTTSPGSTSSVTRSQDRTSAISSRRIAHAGRASVLRSDVEPDGHEEVAVPVVAPLEQPGPQRADEPESNLVAGDAVDAVAQELDVEADLEGLAGERDRE